MTTDEKNAKRIDELSRDRAEDTQVMLDRHTAAKIRDVEGLACACRELEWLASRMELMWQRPRHVDNQGAGEAEDWAADASSVLTVIYKQRYYLAAKSESSAARSVYPVRAAVKAERIPYELKFRNIKAAWFHQEPPSSARSSAPSRTARHARVRSQRR